jgi:hypothetical protein
MEKLSKNELEILDVFRKDIFLKKWITAQVSNGLMKHGDIDYKNTSELNTRSFTLLIRLRTTI